MTKEQQFILYLNNLKNDKNTTIVESIVNEFNTILEYRIHGNQLEKLDDIMETNDSNDGNDEIPEPILEFDDTELTKQDMTSKLTLEVLKLIERNVEEYMRKLRKIIDSGKFIKDEEEAIKYIKYMRSNKWREELLNHNINPATVKGIVPINESFESANEKLLECIDIAKKIYGI